MNTNRRFAVERQIIDTLNPAQAPFRLRADEPDDDRYLREKVLNVRLQALIDKLIVNVKPKQTQPILGEYEAFKEGAHEMFVVMSELISAHVSALDPGGSIQHAHTENLVRTREDTRDFSSLALFVEDIELLLRDLYDVDIPTLDRIRSAVWRVARSLTNYVRKDLWQEHQDAIDFDYILGVGVPDGAGISGSEHRYGLRAKASLIARVRDVEANPSAFSEYTVEFAKRFGQHWDCSRLDPEDSLLDIAF